MDRIKSIVIIAFQLLALYLFTFAGIFSLVSGSRDNTRGSIFDIVWSLQNEYVREYGLHSHNTIWTAGKIVGVLFVISLIACIIACILKLLGKKVSEKAFRISVIAPCICMVIVLIIWRLLIKDTSLYNSLNVTAYILFVLLIASVIVAFIPEKEVIGSSTSIGNTNQIKEKLEEHKLQKIKTNENLEKKSRSGESLKEIKQLLDDGLITQEEYDEKRKQILERL